MKNYSREDILRMVEEEDIEFIRLQFTDLFGNLKNMAITSSQLEKALDNRCVFDGAAIEGFTSVEESDLCLHPNLDTFAIFPWRPQQGKVARLVCDVYDTEGNPYKCDGRYILKKAIAEAEKMGYSMHVGPEIEFFLFHSDENGQPTTIAHEKAGYFDMGPMDFGENARRDIILTLEDMGFEVEASHHEMAPAQHEIDFAHDETLNTAERINTFKLTVRAVAKRHGLHATFMPKPVSDCNGSGMHLHMSLYDKNGKNVLCDPSDSNGLSKEAYYFIGGLMKHIQGITAVTNPLVNSYKRLVPGYEAPVYVAWCGKSRSPLIRVPSSRGESTRIELRSPDPSANPYLTLALCLAAGMDGIRKHIMAPEPVNGNISLMTEAERKKAGISSLPETLMDAIRAMESDEMIKDVLGEEAFNKYVQTKKAEWNEYRNQVTKWEINEYLNRY